jgi:hypothetical protein
MTFMTMHDGTELSVAHPKLDQVNIGHIAHNLALMNRFNGATCRPYSVAEHSLLCLDLAERVLGLSVHGQMAALMHDAHEAYCGDMIQPMKAQVGQAWRMHESSWEHLIDVRFNLKTHKFTHRSQITLIDRMALAIESAQLLPAKRPDGSPRTPWPILQGIEVPDDINLMERGRVAMTWQEWRDHFADRFAELDAGRAEHARDMERRAA